MKPIYFKNELLIEGENSYCMRSFYNELDVVIKVPKNLSEDSSRDLTIEEFCFSDPVSRMQKDNILYEQKKIERLYEIGFPVITPVKHEHEDCVITLYNSGKSIRSFIEDNKITDDSLKKVYERSFDDIMSLHFNYKDYHGDPNPTNILVNKDRLYWCDFETKAIDDKSFFLMKARDLRIFLSSVYIDTGSSDFTFNLLRRYNNIDKDIVKLLSDRLDNVNYPNLLEIYENLGYGNPLKLKDLIRGL
jgi:tRNA A-37 threonylcarbamoyl transferase component Bud32